MIYYKENKDGIYCVSSFKCTTDALCEVTKVYFLQRSILYILIGGMYMRKKLIIGIFVIISLLVSGCTNKEVDTFNEEKEKLTNEIIELKKLISEKDEKISNLEKVSSERKTELYELKDSLTMVRYSASARLYDYNDTFSNLKNTYKIHSNNVIKDDWYVINEDYFQIELLEYEDAIKVDFYTVKLATDQGPMLAFTDTDPTDGWIYTSDNISQILTTFRNPPVANSGLHASHFVIYAEVTLKDGTIIRTSKLPIYNQ